MRHFAPKLSAKGWGRMTCCSGVEGSEGPTAAKLGGVYSKKVLAFSAGMRENKRPNGRHMASHSGRGEMR